MWKSIRKHGKKIAIVGGIVLLAGLTLAIPPLGVAGYITGATLVAVDVVVTIGVSVATVGTALTVAGIAGKVADVEYQQTMLLQEQLRQAQQEAVLAQAGVNGAVNNAVQNVATNTALLEKLSNFIDENQQIRTEINNQNQLLNTILQTSTRQHNEAITVVNDMPAEITKYFAQHGFFSSNNPNPAAQPKTLGAPGLAQRPREFHHLPTPTQ